MTAFKYKSAERRKIVAAGYRIVLNVGDQWSDLHGQSQAEYSVKYPDPFYVVR
jgi:predicted secreted acid phosphatase